MGKEASHDADTGSSVSASSGPRRSWWLKLFDPVDIAFLVYLRVAFGGLMLLDVWQYYRQGWVESLFIRPRFHFKYYGFEWVEVLPGNGLYWVFLVMGLSAVGVVIGLCYRFSIVVFFLCFTYSFLLDQTYYLNHYYLIVLLSFLMVFVPANRAFSVDVWLRPRLRMQTVPTWTLWLLRIQIGIPYFFGGIAKLDYDWLLGIPMLSMLMDSYHLPVIGRYMTEWWVADIFAFGGLVFDLAIVPLLLWPRTRMLAFIACVGFHLTNTLLLNIGIFPWMMIASTLVFFSPNWPRLVLRRCGMAGPTVIPAEPFCTLSRRNKVTLTLLGGYLAVQILMPMRPFIYPGNSNWTEEGHRFSWHMKLRGKEAEARFFLVDPATQQTTEIDVMPYLTDRQYMKMSMQPDMLLQFAHLLDRELKNAGYNDLEIRARVMVSLNDRKFQLMIDPTVNLAAQPRNLWPASWILPLKNSVSGK